MHKEIRDTVEECLKKAESFYGESIPRPRIRFDLKGCAAGKAFYAEGWLRFNVPLAQNNPDDFLKQIVPHEVAHWVQRWKYGYDKKKVLPHGWQWRKVMIEIFRLSPKRCHKYEVKKVFTVGRWDYVCDCQSHNVSTIVHNRIQRGHPYLCKKCGKALRREGASAKIGLQSEQL